MFDVRGFLSTTTFIVSRQQRFSYEAQNLFVAALVAVLIAASCSSSSSEDGNIGSDGNTTTSQSVTVPASAVPATAASSTTPDMEEVSVIVPFTSGNGSGYVTVLVMVRLWWLGLAVFLARFRWIWSTLMLPILRAVVEELDKFLVLPG